MTRMARAKEILRLDSYPLHWRVVLLVCTVLSITTIMTFYVADYLDTTSYESGRVARHTVVARRDISFQDDETTQRARTEAKLRVPRVYYFDDLPQNSAGAKIDSLFRFMRELANNRQEGSQFVLSEEQRIEIEKVFTFDIGNEEWNLLLNESHWSAIRNEVLRLILPIVRRGILADKDAMPSSPSNERIIVRRLSTQREDTYLYRNSFFDQSEAFAEFVSSFPTGGFGRGEQFDAVVRELCKALLKPNVIFDEKVTIDREKRAGSQVNPAFVQIRRGEVIVRAGSVITPIDQQKLQVLREHQTKTNLFETYLSYIVLCSIILISVYSFTTRFWAGYRPSNRDLLVTAITLVGSVWLLKFFSGLSGSLSYSADSDTQAFLLVSPLAAGGMLLQVILGPASVFLFLASFAMVVAMFHAESWLLILLIVVGNIVGAMALKTCRRRSSFLLAGVRVAAINIILVVCNRLLLPEMSEVEFVTEIVCVIAAGVLSGLLALGLTPVAELIGGYVTDFKLLELASLDRPLLADLSVQAPGTWNHSMVLGQMGEVAAEAIGANGLLTRVGAYYHDVGKMKKPLYFVENQMGRENRHDKLTPSMSALIIRSHVKDGVELAREQNLPQALIDFIFQHHGTGLIEYFYDKAMKDAGEDEIVEESHYRYPGPKPQTKEAGILMLADIIEASSRTLSEPTPAKIQGLVQKAINKVFASGELNESTLTLNDLHRIAKSFTRVLSGIYHRRIEYSESLEKGKETKEGKVGKSDEENGTKPENGKGATRNAGDDAEHRPAGENNGSKKTTDEGTGKQATAESAETLKRLGLS